MNGKLLSLSSVYASVLVRIQYDNFSAKTKRRFETCSHWLHVDMYLIITPLCAALCIAGNAHAFQIPWCRILAAFPQIAPNRSRRKRRLWRKLEAWIRTGDGHAFRNCQTRVVHVRRTRTRSICAKNYLADRFRVVERGRSIHIQTHLCALDSIYFKTQLECCI